LVVGLQVKEAFPGEHGVERLGWRKPAHVAADPVVFRQPFPLRRDHRREAPTVVTLSPCIASDVAIKSPSPHPKVEDSAAGRRPSGEEIDPGSVSPRRRAGSEFHVRAWRSWWPTKRSERCPLTRLASGDEFQLPPERQRQIGRTRVDEVRQVGPAAAHRMPLPVYSAIWRDCVHDVDQRRLRAEPLGEYGKSILPRRWRACCP